MAAISLGTAIIGSAIAGGAAAIYSGGQQAKAIKNAGNQTQQAANQSLQFQQTARDQAKAVLSKYANEGNAARGRQSAFLGLNQPGQQYSGAMGSTEPDFAAYVRNNPDLAAEFSKPQVAQQFGGDPAAYGRWHSQNFASEGRPVPTSGMGAADPTKTEAETQEQAWAAYEATPFAKIGTMEAGKARDDFLSMAGAQGSSLSGRTARGMFEVAEEAKLRNFGNYFGALGQVTDRGYQADTGIASGGQVFANNASNITQQAGQTAADFSMAKGQNQANTAGDLASWIGWGLGNMGSMGGASGGTTYNGAAGASSAGRARSGGLGSRIR